MSIDELEGYGLVRMDDAQIRSFLASQRTGVLGFPTADAPYLLPLSYGFDGDSCLYFTFLTGSASRKATLSEQADVASVLVYTADTRFNWESVLLEGTLEQVPESEWAAIGDALDGAWRPDLFETAARSSAVSIYEFQIQDQSGVKHTGLPPELER
ncbi:pyridoxamine 5'-phosphate oxidase family protein [Natronobiforma cellulositropha]|uniref:pyridoxamine 5'-phosphate oxidase family protein n=1 Tax=Natronobiforma cellulositropha TaxID=1679076 RepID=UPI0021D5E780|nr:pyridoxamine 5'-phosphate oxidase family protein [Natronobiforma cellulositropha]